MPSRGPKPKHQATVLSASTAMQPPKHLDQVARRKWRDTVEKLSTAGLLSTLDSTCLEVYCDNYALWLKAKEQILATGGEVVRGNNGYEVPNPWKKIRDVASKDMHWFEDNFGLTPKSRTRLTLKEHKPEEDKWKGTKIG